MKAVIQVSGRQSLVSKDDTLAVDRLTTDKKTITLEPLMVIDGDKVTVGTPNVTGAKVVAEIVEPETKGEKVKIMKFQSKKRVKKLTGHRQPQTVIRIKSIALK